MGCGWHRGTRAHMLGHNCHNEVVGVDAEDVLVFHDQFDEQGFGVFEGNRIEIQAPLQEQLLQALHVHPCEVFDRRTSSRRGSSRIRHERTRFLHNVSRCMGPVLCGKQLLRHEKRPRVCRENKLSPEKAFLCPRVMPDRQRLHSSHGPGTDVACLLGGHDDSRLRRGQGSQTTIRPADEQDGIRLCQMRHLVNEVVFAVLADDTEASERER
mmetsp:Transcript_77840/g.218438  ORF Transcript_77840/g.218438 Transcript_77840/m.218438 type:complete len:212 (+) Transcript_77840:1054-1689(+)